MVKEQKKWEKHSRTNECFLQQYQFENSIPMNILKQKQSEGQQLHYESIHSCFSRRIFFSHIFSFFWKMRKSMLHENSQGIDSKNMPEIKESDKSEYLLQKMNLLLSKYDREKLSLQNFWTAIFHLMKREHLMIIIMMLMFFVSKIVVIVLFYYVLENLKADRTFATVTLAAIKVAVLYLSVTLIHNVIYESSLIQARIRSVLVSILFQKVIKLNQYTLKREQIGKLSNMISNDFNMIEMTVNHFYGMLVAPIIYPLTISLMIWWMGAESLIYLGVFVLSLPLQILIGAMMEQKLEEANIHKDKRVRIISVLIQNLKRIKTFAYEPIIKKKICEQKEKETKKLFTYTVLQSIVTSISYCLVIIGSLIAFYVKYLNGGLSTQMIFSVSLLIVFLQDYNFHMAHGLQVFFQLNVIFRRFISILKIKNMKMIKLGSQQINEEDQEKRNENSENISNDKLFIFQDFNGFWNHQSLQIPSLQKINLKITRNKIYGLTGVNNSACTSLLLAISQQMPYYSGKIRINCSTSHYSDEPILLQASIKENVVFKRKFNEKRYQIALIASDLVTELSSMPSYDLTIVNGKRDTFSQGLRAHISLARCLYAKADIYLLDDPFAALDPKVGNKIFDEVTSHFRGSTILLRTNDSHLLKRCDEIIVMKDEKIQSIMSTKQQQKSTIIFPSRNQQKVGNPEERDEQLNNNKIKESPETEGFEEICKKSFWNYYFFKNKCLSIVAALLLFSVAIFETLYFQILSYFERQEKEKILFRTMNQFWQVLGGIAVTYFCIFLFSYITFNLHLLLVNKKIHSKMVACISNSKIPQFDWLNSERLISKFSNDLGALDHTMPYLSIQTFMGVLTIFVIMINFIIISPYLLILVFLNMILIIVVFKLVLRMVILSKEVDLDMKTPIFARITQLNYGVREIQLSGVQQSYLKQTFALIDQSFKCNAFVWFIINFSSYLVDLVVWLVAACGIFLGLFFVDNDTYALLIVLLLQEFDYFSIFILFYANQQSMLVNCNRCFSVFNIPQQKNSDENNATTTSFFIEDLEKVMKNKIETTERFFLENQGNIPIIKLQSFSMKYRPQLPLTLRGLNLQIKSKERVGIVGRTGAGKSSLIHSLLRFCDPEPGSKYELMGLNACEMGLHSVRRFFSVIPQDPFFYEGTIRENLDFQGEVTEEELWMGLRKVNLEQRVQSLPDKLDHSFSDASEIFSSGQKQLFCLARAFLSSSKVLLFDEATSNVDGKTEALIQSTMKEEFGDRTIITIAHRLLTVADYDRIVVLHEGRIVEIGHPFTLIRSKGIFFEMVESNKSHCEQIKETARKAYEKAK